MPDEPQEVDVRDFAAEPRRHLRASWQRGVPLVLTVEGETLVIESLADLEAVQAALDRQADSPTSG